MNIDKPLSILITLMVYFIIGRGYVKSVHSIDTTFDMFFWPIALFLEAFS